MFDNIAERYDFLNHFLSLGIDKMWRKKAIRMLRPHHPKKILDVATGTGDFAFEALRLKPKKVVGIDISQEMLRVGITKKEKRKKADVVEFQLADSENIPFDAKAFDAITVAFGVRNFENLDKGLKEMFRVLNAGGVLVVIEFSKPKKFPIEPIYNFYFKNLLPRIGKWVSKDAAAYQYLPDSVAAFPEGNAFAARLKDAGFTVVEQHLLTGGIATIYKAKK